ncbi:SprT family zinc-dependent metalloprotease [Alteromonas sp. ASW11-19]|uniref:SprT family zinc-dependent metalloprotease n=1 Tax=Alteromonas salexigens TaxID=2982530 RepID=A0ABT2VM24_9ALTE|nr:SprT family zinc-dependent metalloprotease [Alteromonas salexigens]MCU7554375.1 SprT family zinc-dependent metalloprotease [Alteromonas salexigens]
MSQVTQTARAAVMQRVAHLYNEAQQHFQRRFPLPEITYRRSGRNAGTAFLNQNRINLNGPLFTANQSAFLAEVVPHEVSHLLVWQLYGRVKPHGEQWQYVMETVFDTPATTTHQFDLAPLNISTYPYRCQCDVVQLSVRRHNKVLRGQRYVCRRCNTSLVACTSTATS